MPRPATTSAAARMAPSARGSRHQPRRARDARVMGGSVGSVEVAPSERPRACVRACPAGCRAGVGRAAFRWADVWRWCCVSRWVCGLAWVGERFVGRRDVDIAGFSRSSPWMRGRRLAHVVVSRARHTGTSIRSLGTGVHMPFGYIPNGRMADARARARWYNCYATSERHGALNMGHWRGTRGWWMRADGPFRSRREIIRGT